MFTTKPNHLCSGAPEPALRSYPWFSVAQGGLRDTGPEVLAAS